MITHVIGSKKLITVSVPGIVEPTSTMVSGQISVSSGGKIVVIIPGSSLITVKEVEVLQPLISVANRLSSYSPSSGYK